MAINLSTDDVVALQAIKQNMEEGTKRDEISTYVALCADGRHQLLAQDIFNGTITELREFHSDRFPKGEYSPGDLGPVDKLGSQISFDLIQSSFYGGYRGSFADGRYGVGVL
jgi:hypothetical protein